MSRGACSSWAEIAAPRRWVEGEGAGGSCAAGFGWARAEAAYEAGPDLELGFGGRSGCFSGEVERRLPGPERGARVCPAALPTEAVGEGGPRPALPGLGNKAAAASVG